jgi:hypothetical protein
MTDLGVLVPGSRLPQRSSAYGISDRVQIVGIGEDSIGRIAAVL